MASLPFRRSSAMKRLHVSAIREQRRDASNRSGVIYH